MKCWLHISEEEQLQRFELREQTAYKSWKLTDEDWRNRAQWGAYAEAVSDMLVKTSTTLAPWTVVPANDKRYARVFVLQTIVDALERELDLPDDFMADLDLGKGKKGKKKKSKKNGD